MDRAYDARAIANLILDEAEQSKRSVTNLALQKLLYFAHALFLIEYKCPLVSGYFEAWKLGPVHPGAYQAFKSAADRPIEFRACRVNVLSGVREAIPLPTDVEVVAHVKRVMASYGRLTPGRLVDIAHAKGAPWDAIVAKGTTGVAVGLRIPDDVIIARFKYHKVAVGVTPSNGEPGENTPFT